MPFIGTLPGKSIVRRAMHEPLARNDSGVDHQGTVVQLHDFGFVTGAYFAKRLPRVAMIEACEQSNSFTDPNIVMKQHTVACLNTST